MIYSRHQPRKQRAEGCTIKQADEVRSAGGAIANGFVLASLDGFFYSVT
jgi:hypothetical protein